MTTRTFTFEEGSSSKFWEVTTHGAQLTIRFGRLGATGQTQLKSLASASAAAAEADALIRSKLKKGYVEATRAPVKRSAGKAPSPEALLKALRLKDTARAKALLEAGVDVNVVFPDGLTPLHYAAGLALVDLIDFLAARGVNLEARDTRNRTPYMTTSSFVVRHALKKAGARGLDSTNGRTLKPKAKKVRPSTAEVDGAALGVDAKGDLWLAGYEGLQRWDGKTLTRYEFEESFSVERIVAGTKGLLFFSTNWGIVTFDGKGWRLVSPEDSELHDQHITDFAVDRRGLAYALGYGGEETLDRPISRYDGSAVTVLLPGVDLPKGLETKTVAFDEKNQMVFLTSQGLRFPVGKKWFPGGNEFDRVVFDGATVWGDAGFMGLFRRTGGSTKKFDFDDGVEALCLAGKTMWVGNSGGLHHIDGDRVTRLDGFFADGVDGLALGKSGTLWVSSDGKPFSVVKGVVRTLEGKVVAPQGDEPEA